MKSRLLRILGYKRMSDEKRQARLQARALARQDQDIDRLAESVGGSVADADRFSDPDVSAYKIGVHRPGFEAMMVALPDADGLAVYDMDRVSRDPAVLERLIAIYVEHPHLIFLAIDPETGERDTTLDLATEAGREKARYAVLAARKESRRLSERQSRRYRQDREDGRSSTGHRPFGETMDRQSLVEPEAELLRQAAADLLVGKPLYQIAREWADQGITATTGKELTRGTLRDMLLSPRMAGFVVHRPPRQKGQPAVPIHEAIYVSETTGKPVRAVAGPIFDPDPDVAESTWRAVVDELTGRAETRRTARAGNRPKYLLSGLVWCSRCPAPMFGSFRKERGHHVYVCSKGKHSVSGPQLDALVSAALIEHWSESPTLVVAPEPFTGDDRIAELESQASDLEDAYAAGSVKIDRYLRTQAKIDAELDPLVIARDAYRKAMAAPKPADTADLFEAATVDGRRLMAHRELRRILIGPGRTGVRTLDPARVTLAWHS